jgi:hypothetical protein
MAQPDVSKLQDLLKPRDKSILDAQAGTSWVPPNPRELLLPYLEEDKEVDRTSVEFRRQKAKEVYDGYGILIEECKEVEAEIEKQSKNVKVTLDPTTHLRVKEAVQRVFPGSNGLTITFDMYKKCIQALAKTGSDNIPKPGGKE